MAFAPLAKIGTPFNRKKKEVPFGAPDLGGGSASWTSSTRRRPTLRRSGALQLGTPTFAPPRFPGSRDPLLRRF
eukprot:scaffold56567_cov35-Tisochrysis_lutea.AAC.2